MGFLDKKKVNVNETEKKIEEVKQKIEEKEKEIEEMKSEKEETKILVVKELPTQEVRQVEDKDGKLIDLITIEEALTKIMNSGI